jgi:hypothetical protein
MISYYDIRAARTAMRALQNKPLRRRKLDIHFSIPKVLIPFQVLILLICWYDFDHHIIHCFVASHQDNPSDKDINQGTLVVFNLDPSVSNEDLRQIFGAYGEVKEVIGLHFQIVVFLIFIQAFLLHLWLTSVQFGT